MRLAIGRLWRCWFCPLRSLANSPQAAANRAFSPANSSASRRPAPNANATRAALSATSSARPRSRKSSCATKRCCPSCECDAAKGDREPFSAQPPAATPCGKNAAPAGLTPGRNRPSARVADDLPNVVASPPSRRKAARNSVTSALSSALRRSSLCSFCSTCSRSCAFLHRKLSSSSPTRPCKALACCSSAWRRSSVRWSCSSRGQPSRSESSASRSLAPSSATFPSSFSSRCCVRSSTATCRTSALNDACEASRPAWLSRRSAKSTRLSSDWASVRLSSSSPCRRTTRAEKSVASRPPARASARAKRRSPSTIAAACASTSLRSCSSSRRCPSSFATARSARAVAWAAASIACNALSSAR
mmetsp:Transcript_92594/g.299425  ORF Transcript_92594/g.299425 Transcript_92594/m.299425 type:complete len:361 (+) Transcript_92594:272-1354(+)